jgi:hypothetical protein
MSTDDLLVSIKAPDINLWTSNGSYSIKYDNVGVKYYDRQKCLKYINRTSYNNVDKTLINIILSK